MAAKKDLTWQEVQAQLTLMGSPNAIVVSGGKVMIDAGIVTGEDLTALTDETVVEFLYKIREAAGKAQGVANEALPVEDQLQAFPLFSYSAPTEEGFVGVTQVSSFLVPLNLDNIFGPNT
ncbi:hypothetical protein [Nodularia sp. NIES-3585]|uniref:hypothetical protein n=1 Tax=Nodularia sp. NIES-3585 TaxID=1973477 RepID=UPI000B5CBBD7|nr:hypothetical protein [Nodularia sp. NIES-3585]GAX37888.1 hypothetical protein NIES3585_39330 [Nodularia sp. NIES-3585]